MPLTEDDLLKITLQVLARTPLLSSSPGIKFASARRDVWSTDIADVLYYPHADSAGIKEAFRVECQRQMPSESWACDEARIRRYVRLESQDFEVRISGKIGFEEALALIQATRDTVQTRASDGSIVPKIVTLIAARDYGYLVTWRSSEGDQGLMVQAHLSNGGNPANSEDWQASIFKTEDQ